MNLMIKKIEQIILEYSERMEKHTAIKLITMLLKKFNLCTKENILYTTAKTTTTLLTQL